MPRRLESEMEQLQGKTIQGPQSHSVPAISLWGFYPKQLKARICLCTQVVAGIRPHHSDVEDPEIPTVDGEGKCSTGKQNSGQSAKGSCATATWREPGAVRRNGMGQA